MTWGVAIVDHRLQPIVQFGEDFTHFYIYLFYISHNRHM